MKTQQILSTLNALTIDVEDYWSIFSRDWLHIDTQPSDAVVRNTEWFLHTLAQHNVKATFFILGEVAQKFPALIKKIAEQGHEIGSHGFLHKQLFKLNEQQFRKEVTNSKKMLEDITSTVVLGYRAPAFSVMPSTKWALEVLAQEGFKYDSSVYPISGKRYGWPGFSKDICKIELTSGRSIVEVPMSAVTALGRAFPAAGGGYIRHFPYVVTKLAIRHIQKSRPAIVYMHPYEIDAKQIQFETADLSEQQKKSALKFHQLQLLNRASVKKKITKLLRDFEFTTLSKVIEQVSITSKIL